MSDDSLKANGVSDPYSDGYYAGCYDVQQALNGIRNSVLEGKL